MQTTTKKNTTQKHNNLNQTAQIDTENKLIPKFELLGLKEKLLQGIFAYGWEVPSHIQQKALMPLIKGRNLYCQAQAGQGKSGVFVIGSLQIVDEQQPDLQAIIITPVKELAQQTYEVFKGVGKYMRTNVRLSIGGSKMMEEKAAYSQSNANPVQIAVGTPGRIVELAKKNFINTSRVKLLILDEADKLFEDNFAEAISQLLQSLPSDVQIGLISATMPIKMIEISKGLMNGAEQIFIRNDELPPASVKQFYIDFDQATQKQDVLMDLLSALDIQLCIIFVNTQKGAEDLAQFMQKQRIDTLMIHGQMEQEQRNEVMQTFKDGNKSRYLISSDILSRGLDVLQVNVVINFDMTHSKETYIHRMGRAGRAGSFGVVISFVTKEDAKYLLNVEKSYQCKVEAMPVDVAKIYGDQVGQIQSVDAMLRLATNSG